MPKFGCDADNYYSNFESISIVFCLFIASPLYVFRLTLMIVAHMVIVSTTLAREFLSYYSVFFGICVVIVNRMSFLPLSPPLPPLVPPMQKRSTFKFMPHIQLNTVWKKLQHSFHHSRKRVIQSTCFALKFSTIFRTFEWMFIDWPEFTEQWNGIATLIDGISFVTYFYRLPSSLSSIDDQYQSNTPIPQCILN